MKTKTNLMRVRECNLLSGLLYGGYAQLVIYGDSLERTHLICWDSYHDYDTGQEWEYASDILVTPSYVRLFLPTYLSLDCEGTDTIFVLRDGKWEQMDRSKATGLVTANRWPTSFNKEGNDDHQTKNP